MQEVKAEIRSIKRKNDKVDNKVEDNEVIKNTAPKKKRVRFY
jgi:hypothetical protein